jgi:hypothetical protein
MTIGSAFIAEVFARCLAHPWGTNEKRIAIDQVDHKVVIAAA